MPLIHVSRFVSIFHFGYFSSFLADKQTWVGKAHVELGQLGFRFFICFPVIAGETQYGSLILHLQWEGTQKPNT